MSRRGFKVFEAIEHPLEQSVFPILAKVGLCWIAIGTGFVARSYGLLITARHVLEDGFDLLYHDRDLRKPKDEDIGLYAFFRSNPDFSANAKGHFWPLQLEGLVAQRNIDIAFIRMRGATHKPTGQRTNWPALGFSPGIPKIGDRLTAFGYFGAKREVVGERVEGLERAKWFTARAFSIGTVQEVFPEKRDNSMLPFPVLRTDAQYRGCMSGGPVFNVDGLVCGIVCSSYEVEKESPHISYVSLIWPAFGVEIEKRSANDGGQQFVSMYDLAKAGHIECDSSVDHLQLVEDGEDRYVFGIWH